MPMLVSDQETQSSNPSDVIARLSGALAQEQNSSQPVSDGPAPDPAEPEQEGEPQAADEVSSDESLAQPEDPLVELQHLGKTYQVPTSLKTAFESNRTKANVPSAELAKLREALFIERQVVEAERAMRDQTRDEFNELSKVEAQIDQLKKLDWSSLSTEQMMQARNALDVLRDNKEDLTKKIDSKRNEFVRNADAAMREAQAKGLEYLTKVVPGWNQEVATEVASYAKDRGVTDQEIRHMHDPRFIHIMWEASQFRKIQASKPQLKAKTQNAAPVARPSSSAASASTANAKEAALRQQLKKDGNVNTAAALLKLRMR